MLAPRKVLWTTPNEVVKEAIHALNLHNNDVIVDIGCGEGNFIVECGKWCLLQSTELQQSIRLFGVEIDIERAKIAEERVEKALGENIDWKILTGNALELDYSDCTAFFLYLIPRGLRIILPILKTIRHPIRVCTFMNPLPGIKPTETLHVHSEKHAESAWPLFVYHLDFSSEAKQDDIEVNESINTST